eukprot:1793615-Pyramimonas_sp.AAC.1
MVLDLTPLVPPLFAVHGAGSEAVRARKVPPRGPPVGGGANAGIGRPRGRHRPAGARLLAQVATRFRRGAGIRH